MMYTLPMQDLVGMRFLAVAVMICAVLATCSDAKPLSTSAAQDIVVLADLLKEPIAKRQLSDSATLKFTELATGDDGDRQLVAVLTLAWAKDEDSLKVLQNLAQSPKVTIVSGAAAYALLVRANFGKTSDDLRSALSSRLVCSKNQFQRMFIANRLFVDFRTQALQPILAAARTETDKIVKCDMLYYLADLSDANSAKDVLSWEWIDPLSLPESTAYIMGTITPGRPKDDLHNSSYDLLKKLREKAGQGGK